MARREDEALALGRADARRRAAEAAVAARPHLDEDERAVALAHDQIDLAAARARAARDAIIAPHQHQPGGAQVSERARFGGVAERLGRGRDRHRGPGAGGRISGGIEARRGRGRSPPPASSIPPAALYVVATPIGNLADLTLRALHVLALVDAIACEDTRHSAALLRHFAIAKPLIAVHEHNEREAAGAVLARLARGERVAYVSDAGTPAVSDPGAALVAAARAAGHRVVPIPGASSALAALSVAGDAGAARLRLRRLPRGARRRARARARARWRAQRRRRSCSRRRTASNRCSRRWPRPAPTRRRRCAASSPSSSRRS